MPFELRPYQESAADFIYERDRSLILAPVGAGKTAITATAMQDMIRDGVAKRFLVFAPKRVCTDVWPVEIPKFAPGLTFALAAPDREAVNAAARKNATETNAGKAQRKAAVEGTPSVVIVNYDVSVQLAEQYPDLSLYFDGVVFDELTRYKTAGDTRSLKKTAGKKAKRFIAAYKSLDKIHIRIGLTGSFTSNGLEDTFGQCKMIDAKLLGSTRSRFMAEYFVCVNRDFGDYAPRPGALARVMERIKPATFVLESGAYTLPALNITPMTCEMELSAYKKMKADLVLEHADGQITAVNAAVATGKLLQLASGWAYDTQSTPDPSRPGKWNVVQTPVWFSGAKFDLLDELIQENQHAPMLVWYSFKEQLAELRRRYPHLQTLDDPNAIERWNAGKIELLAAHPMSASHGLNLQSGGSKMVFITLPWSLELYEQAIGRLHRSGQTQPVWVYVLLTKGTVDERVFQGLTDKKDMTALALEVLRG